MKEGDIYRDNSKFEFKIITIQGGRVQVEYLNSKNKYEFDKSKIIKGEIEDSIFKENEFIGKIYPQNCGDSLKVIKKLNEKKGSDYLYECIWVKYPNICNKRKNDILSKSNTNPLIEQKEFIEKIHPQNCGDDIIVIEKSNKKGGNAYLFKCKFKKYCIGEIYLRKDSILNGTVSNKSIPDSLGFYLGYGIEDKKIHSIWNNLKNKCYNPTIKSFDYYGEKGITICEEWKNFQNFAKWYQENSYECEEPLELDKDILCNIKQLEVKIYSPETCLLIPKKLNQFCRDIDKNSGIQVRSLKFRSSIRFKNKSISLGTFDTFDEAKKVYLENKNKFWLKLINEYKELPIKIKEILLQFKYK